MPLTDYGASSPAVNNYREVAFRPQRYFLVNNATSGLGEPIDF